MTLNGIDVSGWQPDDITKIVTDYDFVIIKATGGSTYTSAKAEKQAQGALSAGKPIGFYHFAKEKEEDKGYKSEADNFLKRVTPFLKNNPVLALDWEADAAKDLPIEWAKNWLEYVFQKTGIRPLFYSFESFTKSEKAKPIIDAGFELWTASFGNGKRLSYTAAPSTPPEAHGKKPLIFQFTDTGRLNGYQSDLDLNIFYGSLADFKKLGEKIAVDPTPTEPTPVTPTPPTPKPDVPRKSGQILAAEVLQGKWGNGPDRVRRLREAGYNAEAVQNEVNLVLTRQNVARLAQEVIDQKWGNGDERKARLKAEGWDYQTIQNEVNRRLGTKPISQLADEVLAGRWGVDPIRTARLKTQGYDAAAVQAEVNRRLKL